MKYLIKLLLVGTLSIAIGNCLEDFGSATGFEEESHREPFNLDYVEGDFPVFRQTSRPQPSSSNLNPFGSPNVFQQSFGNFFDFNPFPSFGNNFENFGFDSFNFRQPWHRGPNVCTTRDESAEGSDVSSKKESSSEAEELSNTGIQDSSFIHHFSLNVESCQETSTKHICKRITNQQGQKKTVTTTKQCCHGFARQPPLGYCEKVELHSLNEIAEKLNTKSFMEVAENNGLKDVMQTNVTVFMPSDESFKTYTQDMLNEADGGMKDLLLNHLVEGFVDIEEVDNEQILNTQFENHTIRLNVFPKIRNRRQDGIDEEDDSYRYLYTANCVPIMKANQHSNNGIVHKTRNVLKPVSQSLMEIIRGRNDMTVLRTVLEKTQMDLKIDAGKDFTIFAPNDAAFEKLDAQFKRKIKEGGSCAEKIMENHILRLTFCSSAVIDNDSRVSAFNMLGEKMSLERSSGDDDNSTDNEINTTNESSMNILVNGKSRMIEEDLMATNGVLHVIDDVLITESALPFTTMLGHQNLTIFKKLIEYGGFSNDFDNLENITYFAPNDEAFERSDQGKYWLQMLDESPQKLKNNEKLKRFLEYHVVSPLIKTRDLKEEMLTSIDTEHDQLRVNLYSTMPSFANIMNRATINCARVIHFDQETCGSVFHQVDSVLTVPEMNILEMLRTNPRYSQFYKLVVKANLSSLLEDENHDSGFTVLVPNDDIFNELSDWIKEKKETGEIDDLVKNHIIAGVKCCAGIVRSQWPFVNSFKTISNNNLNTNRDRRPRIQNSAVTKCDLTAKNGIIHEINDVINVETRRQEQPTNSNNNYGIHNIFNRPFFFKK